MKEEWIKHCLQIDLHQNLNLILITILGVLKLLNKSPLTSYSERMEKIYYNDSLHLITKELLFLVGQLNIWQRKNFKW